MVVCGDWVRLVEMVAILGDVMSGGGGDGDWGRWKWRLASASHETQTQSPSSLPAITTITTTTHQVLITCLFPGTPRAANALISFNNKQVVDAIPAFQDLVLPIAKQVDGDFFLFKGLFNIYFFLSHIEGKQSNYFIPNP